MIGFRPRTLLAGTLLAGVLLAPAGCASTRTVSGKILPGRAGVAMVVQANDPRLEEAGLGGVELRVTDGSAGMGSIASATSKPDGSFQLRVPQEAISQRLEVHATSDAVLPFHGSAILPMDDRRLLVIVEPHRPMEGGEQPR